MKGNFPRFVLAAPQSGSGKTTMTCALLQAFVQRGLKTGAFKCGPDYIDPMFHSKIIGAKSRNLDLFFVGEERLKGLFCKAAADCEISVIEGVMGYYDGLGGTTTRASTWAVTRATQSPALLIIDPKGSSVSAAAQISGFLKFRENSGIRGVLLNRCSAMTAAMLTPVIENETGLKVYGYLPPMPECALESRHLGLVTAGEIADLKEKMQKLAAQAEKTLMLDEILRLAQEAPPLEGQLPEIAPLNGAPPKIAVALDEAFCFYYEENLELLRSYGAQLCFFSPLREERLPEGSAAVYLGGGYPELYAAQLSENHAMGAALRQADAMKMPILAECGGFMALHETMEGADGKDYPLFGVIPGRSFRTHQLGRFGYITLRPRRETLLCRENEELRAHEFHYWDSTRPGKAMRAEKPVSGRSWNAVWSNDHLFAGYPHLYFWSEPHAAQAFVLAAQQAQERIWKK